MNTYWPNWAPPQNTINKKNRNWISKAHACGWKPPLHLVKKSKLRDPNQWDHIQVPVGGKQLNGTARHITVTRWVWDLFVDVVGDGVKIVAHGDNKGKGYLYPVPSHPHINRAIKAEGKTSNCVTLAPMLLTVAGFIDYNARVQFCNGSPFDQTLNNIDLNKYPKTPKGEEARRSRVSIRVMNRLIEDFWAGRSASPNKNASTVSLKQPRACAERDNDES